MKRTTLSPASPRSRQRTLPSWTRAVIVGALAAALVPAAAADHILTFDNLDTGYLGNNDPDLHSDGFTVAAFSNAAVSYDGDLVGQVIDPAHLEDCGTGLMCPNHDSKYMTLLNDGALYVARDNGDTFHVKSFDASFLGAPAISAPYSPGFIRVQGVRADHTSTYADFDLAQPSGGQYSFMHQSDAAFASESFASVYFYGFACDSDGYCRAFQTDRGQFAIDNIVTGPIAAVPEPSSWLMLGAGLLGLATRARRRSA